MSEHPLNRDNVTAICDAPRRERVPKAVQSDFGPQSSAASVAAYWEDPPPTPTEDCEELSLDLSHETYHRRFRYRVQTVSAAS
jgi:hypothetical protein